MKERYKDAAQILGVNSEEKFETLQQARKDLIGEIDAIMQYDAHIHESNNPVAIGTWEDIRNEEMVHVGQLLGLIGNLAPYQKELVDKGMREFEEIIKNNINQGLRP